MNMEADLLRHERVLYDRYVSLEEYDTPEWTPEIEEARARWLAVSTLNLREEE